MEILFLFPPTFAWLQKSNCSTNNCKQRAFMLRKSEVMLDCFWNGSHAIPLQWFFQKLNHVIVSLAVQEHVEWCATCHSPIKQTASGNSPAVASHAAERASGIMPQTQVTFNDARSKRQIFFMFDNYFDRQTSSLNLTNITLANFQLFTSHLVCRHGPIGD